MTPEKQRIAIAESLGEIPGCIISEEYVTDPHWNSGFWEITARFENGVEISGNGRIMDLRSGQIQDLYVRKMLPDYLADLNAMHEAEKILTPRQCEKYFGLLATAPYDRSKGLGAEAWQAHATAAQRAEAFLRTLGKWEDSNE